MRLALRRATLAEAEAAALAAAGATTPDAQELYRARIEAELALEDHERSVRSTMGAARAAEALA